MSSLFATDTSGIGSVFVLNHAQVPEGDKFKVAQKWGNISIVTRKWFDQSIARRGMLQCSFFFSWFYSSVSRT